MWKPPPTFLWALTSCTSFCDAASATEGAGGAGYQPWTSPPPQRHFNTSCLQAQRTQHPLTSTEALLSLRLSSVNNLGVKVLQEGLESFKLYNHRNDCLISRAEMLRLFPRARTQCAKVWLGRLPSLYVSIWCVLCMQNRTSTPPLLRVERKAGLAFWNPPFPHLSFGP